MICVDSFSSLSTLLSCAMATVAPATNNPPANTVIDVLMSCFPPFLF
jgi:hypothetical protein